MDSLILPAFRRGDLSQGILDGVRGFEPGARVGAAVAAAPWWLIPAAAAGGLLLVAGSSLGRSGRKAGVGHHRSSARLFCRAPSPIAARRQLQHRCSGVTGKGDGPGLDAAAWVILGRDEGHRVTQYQVREPFGPGRPSDGFRYVHRGYATSGQLQQRLHDPECATRCTRNSSTSSPAG